MTYEWNAGDISNIITISSAALDAHAEPRRNRGRAGRHYERQRALRLGRRACVSSS